MPPRVEEAHLRLGELDRFRRGTGVAASTTDGAAASAAAATDAGATARTAPRTAARADGHGWLLLTRAGLAGFARLGVARAASAHSTRAG